VPANLEDLANSALRALRRSWAPYSKAPSAVALRTSNGQMHLSVYLYLFSLSFSLSMSLNTFGFSASMYVLKYMHVV
jgi:hypothetical protein